MGQAEDSSPEYHYTTGRNKREKKEFLVPNKFWKSRLSELCSRAAIILYGSGPPLSSESPPLLEREMCVCTWVAWSAYFLTVQFGESDLLCSFILSGSFLVQVGSFSAAVTLRNLRGHYSTQHRHRQSNIKWTWFLKVELDPAQNTITQVVKCASNTGKVFMWSYLKGFSSVTLQGKIERNVREGAAAGRILRGAKESEQKEPLKWLLQALGRAAPRKSNSHQNGNVCLKRFQTTCFPGRPPPVPDKLNREEAPVEPPRPSYCRPALQVEIQAGKGLARIDCIFCIIACVPKPRGWLCSGRSGHVLGLIIGSCIYHKPWQVGKMVGVWSTCFGKWAGSNLKVTSQVQQSHP